MIQTDTLTLRAIEVSLGTLRIFQPVLIRLRIDLEWLCFFKAVRTALERRKTYSVNTITKSQNADLLSDGCVPSV